MKERELLDVMLTNLFVSLQRNERNSGRIDFTGICGGVR